MKIPAGAWVLIADGKKALFLRNDGDDDYPNLHVIKKTTQTNPPAHEQGTGAPGRMSNGMGPKSAVEDTDWHQLAKDRFAADTAQLLHEQSGRFEQLILVAPPHILGELRKDLQTDVSTKVIGELRKDFTHHPIDQIEQHIARA